MTSAPPPTAAARAYNKMEYQTIYPQYLDATLTPKDGRRLTKTQSVDHPTIEEMVIALHELGYKSFMCERNKSLPRAQGTHIYPVVPRGCLKVAIKEPASAHYIKKSEFDTQTRNACIPGIESKQELLRRIAANIKAKNNPRPEVPTVASIVSSMTSAHTKGGKK